MSRGTEARLLVWVNAAPAFCATLVIEGVPDSFDMRVVESAPILKWTRGKRWADVVRYFRGKRYELVLMTLP
jgi:hypothetical protein